MSDTDRANEQSLVLIQLFKGPVYRDAHERLWQPMLNRRAAIGDYVAVLGLQLDVDETDGYAFLRTKPEGDDESGLPRLVSRHSLSFHVSLLLAMLRKLLAEFDAASSDARLIVSRDQMIEMLRLYLPDTTDEVKTARAIDGHINRIDDLGFIRRLHGDAEQYEVRRILRAFVDGQWLGDFDQRLDDYIAEITDRRAATT